MTRMTIKELTAARNKFLRFILGRAEADRLIQRRVPFEFEVDQTLEIDFARRIGLQLKR